MLTSFLAVKIAGLVVSTEQLVTAAGSLTTLAV
jgi:hypothetical protein